VELQAQTVDLLHALIRNYQIVNSKNAPSGDVHHVPRPGEDVAPEPQAVSLSDFKSFLNG
jgi:hypothetical protein